MVIIWWVRQVWTKVFEVPEKPDSNILTLVLKDVGWTRLNLKNYHLFNFLFNFHSRKHFVERHFAIIFKGCKSILQIQKLCHSFQYGFLSYVFLPRCQVNDMNFSFNLEIIFFVGYILLSGISYYLPCILYGISVNLHWACNPAGRLIRHCLIAFLSHEELFSRPFKWINISWVPIPFPLTDYAAPAPIQQIAILHNYLAWGRWEWNGIFSYILISSSNLNSFLWYP